MKFASTTVLTIILSLSVPAVFAQEVYRFSLQEAIEYAMENNYDIIYSEKNVEAAKQQVRETTAMGLPKLDGAVDYADNIALPVTVIPETFMDPVNGNPDKLVPFSFGSKYSMNAGLYASQLLFSGQYIVGLKTAKIFLEKTNIDFFRDKVAVRQQVADSYFNVLSAEEALWVIDTTLAVTRKLAEETRKTYEVGFVEDIDVDQLELLVSDLEANKVYMNNQLGITQAYLKFYLGLNDKDSLVLTDDMENLIARRQNAGFISQPFDYRQNVDYASLAKNKEISLMQVKLEQTNYMPTLLAKINLQTNAQRREWDFFDSDGAWYASSVFGVSLVMPLWSSGERQAKVKQAKIAFEQVEIMEEKMVNTLNLQYQTAVNEYVNAKSVYENKADARKVAEKIFNKTSIKFSEGMATSLDILNTQNQYLNAEQEYINSASALLKAGEELNKLLTKTINP